MLKKSLSLLLVGLLLHAMSFVPLSSASAQTESDALLAAKMKAAVARLGIGDAARVKVQLRDKAKLEGYIGAVEEDRFTVTDSKTATAAIVAYPQVKQVKRNNLSTGATIGIGVAIAVAVGIIAVIVAGRGDKRADDPCKSRPCPCFNPPCP